MPLAEMRYSDALPERSVGAQPRADATDLFVCLAQPLGSPKRPRELPELVRQLLDGARDERLVARRERPLIVAAASTRSSEGRAHSAPAYRLLEREANDKSRERLGRSEDAVKRMLALIADDLEADGAASRSEDAFGGRCLGPGELGPRGSYGRESWPSWSSRSALVNRYRRRSRQASELGLGNLAPLDYP
jgi:hypothetical protein